MLIRLFGENFRSLRDPFELSFVAADLPTEGERGVTNVQIMDEYGYTERLDLLNCVAIFGPNASGKSTVLRAGNALEWLIRRASMELKPDDRIPPYEPFAFDESSSGKAVRLGCTVAAIGKLYEYEIEFTRNRVESERLVDLEFPNAPLLTRDADGNVDGSFIKSSSHLAALVSAQKPNTPTFAFITQHGSSSGPTSLNEISKAFLRRLQHRDYSSKAGAGIELIDETAHRMHEDNEYRDWILEHLLRPADIGISDIRTREVQLPTFVGEGMEDLWQHLAEQGPYYRPEFVHHGKEKPLDLSVESTGTRKLYSTASDWWQLSNRDITILGDEISASLHPMLFDPLIRAINDRSSETQSQLAFTTHDVGLLESRSNLLPALRKDQVYFTSKSDDGATTLYSLTEFKDQARPGTHNIRRRYLSDRYGATPHIQRFEL